MAVGGSLTSAVGAWRCNETSAASNIADHSGNTRTLTVSANPAVVTTRVDGARRFTAGSSQYAYRADATQVFAPASLSVHVMFRVKALPSGNAAVVHRGTNVLSASGGGWALYVTSAGVLRFAVRGLVGGVDTLTDNQLLHGSGVIDLDRWYVVDATSSGGQDATSAGGTLNLYLDGDHRLQQTGVPRKLTTSTEQIEVGRLGTAYLSVDVEDAIVYNVIRSAEEVHADARNAVDAVLSSKSTFTISTTTQQEVSGIGSIDEVASACWPVPSHFLPLSDALCHNTSTPDPLIAISLCERLTHLVGARMRLITCREFDSTATSGAGPYEIGRYRWTVSPRCEYVQIRAEAFETNDLATASLEPQLYVDSDTTLVAKHLGRSGASDTPCELVLNLPVTPGQVKDLSLHVKDKLRLRSLVIQEMARHTLDQGIGFLAPEAYRRRQPITDDGLRAMYRALRDVFRYQQKIHAAWSYWEDLTSITINSSTPVNILDGSSTAWSWNARGWVTSAQYCGRGISGYAYATVHVRFASTANTTVTVVTSHGSISQVIASTGGTQTWTTLTDDLPLGAGIPAEMIQVLVGSSATVTITGLTIEGTSDIS